MNGSTEHCISSPTFDQILHKMSIDSYIQLIYLECMYLISRFLQLLEMNRKAFPSPLPSSVLSAIHKQRM